MNSENIDSESPPEPDSENLDTFDTFTSEVLPELGELELHSMHGAYYVYLPGGKVNTHRAGKNRKEAKATFDNFAQFEINRRGSKAAAVRAIRQMPEEKRA